MFLRTLPLLMLAALANGCAEAQVHRGAPSYTYDTIGRAGGFSDGIGKFYMGREIASTMSAVHADWLDRPEREQEERPEKLMDQMDIRPTDAVADIGCGTGHHSLLIAAKAKHGKVYAVDIQRAMLDSVFVRSTSLGLANVDPVLGTEQSPGLRANSVDKVLMVDVYHELAYPKEMMRAVRIAMRTDALLYLVEFRGEDDQVPIKRIHRMTRKQAVREMESHGLVLDCSWEELPWQHLLIFRQSDVR